MSYLRGRVQGNYTVDDIVEGLTSLGAEVDEIVELGKDVVVGNVVSVERHGKGNILRIDVSSRTLISYTTYRDVREGEGVVVALPQAIVFKRNGEMSKVEVAEREGIASECLLCSYGELGMRNDFDHIIKFEGVSPGTPYRDVAPIHDFIFFLSITPDKGYLLGMDNICRELWAYLKIHGRDVQYVPLELINDEDMIDGEKYTLKINHEGCLAYAGLPIIKMGEGVYLDAIESTLIKYGMGCVNPAVDIANYVMIETGQPIHTFKQESFPDREIVVERAKEGYSFLALNGKEYTLGSDEIAICNNGGEVLCLAGIIGGMEHAVGVGDTHLLFEIALFSPTQIRKTSRRLGLTTEASYRFERFSDAMTLHRSIHRLAFLIKKHFPGSRIFKFAQHGLKIEEKWMEVDIPRVVAIMGDIPHLTENKIIEIL